MSFGVRDIRHRYPRITENHLRYLEKWGLVRPAPARGDGEFTFAEVATIKQLATELEHFESDHAGVIEALEDAPRVAARGSFERRARSRRRAETESQ